MQRPRNNIRKITSRTLILCEGTTERLYFSDIIGTLSRQSFRDIELKKAKETEPKKILKEALQKMEKAEKEKQPYKEIWMVFDDDNRNDLKAVFEEGKKENIKIAYSSVSFEYWYFLHFNRKAPVFKNADAAKHVLCKNIPEYCESMAGVFNLINPLYKRHALQNANWLQKQKDYKDMYTAYLLKPITNVNELTEIILHFEK
jgi:hypothetical protein